MPDLERRVANLEDWIEQHAALERVEHLWLFGLMGYARAVVVGLSLLVVLMVVLEWVS